MRASATSEWSGYSAKIRSTASTNWAPIETGMGQQPQVYLNLSKVDRRTVREEVNSRLSPFLSNGKLVLSIEMLMAVGRA